MDLWPYFISEEIQRIMSNFENNISIAQEQLAEDGPCRENPDFDFDEFWNKLIEITKALSHQATTLCLSFESIIPFLANDCQSLLNRLEEKCIALLAVFFTLPKSKGKSFHKEIQCYVLSILQGVKSLSSSIRERRTNEYRSVGGIWKNCENVNNIPKDNKEVIFALCKEQQDLIEDALIEFMEVMSYEEENIDITDNAFDDMPFPSGQSWNSSDRVIILPSSGLIKAVKACIKKTSEAVQTQGDGRGDERSISELDDLGAIVKKFSSIVDDFILSLYPPMNHADARELSTLLRSICKDLLSYVKNAHFCTTTDESWIEFLKKAVDHNWVKINDLVLAD